METDNVDVNIFIFGDLVLDHLIPVSDKKRPHQTEADRVVRDGRPRITTAGGAANCARVIAALSRGRTCLWGLSGHSTWGAFPQILQRCHTIDGADGWVIYHGSHRESHQMNTITRILRMDSEHDADREFRVDDVHYVPVTETQARDAVAYLRAEWKEHGVDAIIFNDLDMKALSEDLIFQVGEFASANQIPVFVDPKRDWQKYRSIAVECALPNLEEWCYLVEDRDNSEHWRRLLRTKDGLERMADRTLRFMPNSRFHIIKCDRDGQVFIGPKDAAERVISHILAHPVKVTGRSEKLGPGDILTASLALEHARMSEASTATSILSALGVASGVVACYLELDWQRVPNRREMAKFKIKSSRTQCEAVVTEGVLRLPAETDVNLADFSIHGSRLVSVDASYRKTIEELVKFLSTGWDSDEPRSAILTGRGGVGKTDVCTLLSHELGSKIRVWDPKGWGTHESPDVDSAVLRIKNKWNSLGEEAKGLLVVIDEAFSIASHLLHGENGKLLLQESARAKKNTRFLFCDADFDRHKAQLSESQFRSRCIEFHLPPLESRTNDIPYIFAASCVRLLSDSDIDEIHVSEAVLLSVINWVLRSGGRIATRDIISAVEATVADARQGWGSQHTPEITMRYLPDYVRTHLGRGESKKRLFRFSWRQARALPFGSH